MIPETSIVICPWCNSDTTVKEWDDNSFAECISRETKRAYKHLTDKKVWGKESKNFYKCPSCGQWVRGNKLKLDTPDKELSKLGGQSLFEIGTSE